MSEQDEQIRNGFEEYVLNNRLDSAHYGLRRDGLNKDFYADDRLNARWDAYKAGRASFVVVLPNSFAGSYGENLMEAYSVHVAIEAAGGRVK